MYSNNVLLLNGTIIDAADLECGDKLLGVDGDFVDIYSTKILRNVPIYRIATKGCQPYYVCQDTKLILSKGNKSSSFFVSNFVKKDDVTIKGLKSYKISRNVSTEFLTTQKLPLDPYLFGHLLLNSTITYSSARVTITKEPFRKAIEEFCESHEMIARKVTSAGERTNSYQLINATKVKKKNTMCELYDETGLCEVRTPERFIPDVYKYSSVRDRLELLAGLFDSSAYKNKNGFQLLTSSKRLADDIVYISKSVGLTASRSVNPSVKNGKEYYNVCIGGNRNIIPYRIPEKRADGNCKDLLSRPFTMVYVGIGDYVLLETSGKYLTEDFLIID